MWPKSKFQSQSKYLGLGCKEAKKCLINEKHGQGTQSTKIGADNCLKIPQMPQNLSAQAQKFGILKKKASLGVRSPWRLT